MSISAAGLSASNAQASPFMTDLNNLGTLLSSGDLTGAQTLYNSIEAKMQAHQAASGTSSTTGSSASNPIASDFAALGTALSSGSTSSALTAFQALQTDLASAAPASASATGTSSSSSQDAWLLAAYLNSGSFSS